MSRSGSLSVLGGVVAVKHALRYIFKSKYTKLVSVLLVAVAAVVIPFAAANTEGPRDCDGNAVMTCGAYTKQEAVDKMNAQGLGGVYADFSISQEELLSADTVDGFVTKNGEIVANGQTIGTQAWSMGRHFMANSTPRVIGGVTFWFRPTKVSFASSQLAAFVNVKEGWAVLKSCGNPVI